MQIRVLSFNIHKGFAALGREFTLGKIREAVRSTRADILCLQEVQGHHMHHGKSVPDYPTEAQFEYLADSMWSHYAYGKNAVYDAGHHGNAILSNFPILQQENINISTNDYERRGMLHVTLQIEELKLHVVTVHLNLLEGGRRAQLKKLEQRLETHVPIGEPLIVAGDFNDWRGNATAILAKAGLQECFVVKTGKEARSFPANFPVLRLDRIYVRGLAVEQAQVCLGDAWSSLSDHAALLTTLQFDERSS